MLGYCKRARRLCGRGFLAEKGYFGNWRTNLFGNRGPAKFPKYAIPYQIRFARPSLALLLHHFVAFAAGGFQPEPVDDVDVPALISNQASLLQYAGGDGDAGPAGSQHVGQKFLGQRHKVGADAVLAHQQPTSQPFIHFVKPVAGGHLGSLHPQDLHIALQAGSPGTGTGA